MPRLFVYGSLKRGFSNHHFLAGQTFLGEARTQPVYRMYDWGGYPAIVPVEDGGVSISGEVWEIDDTCLIRVDWLEAVEDGLYRRAFARLLSPHEEWADVIMYHFAQSITGMPEVGAVWERGRDGK